MTTTNAACRHCGGEIEMGTEDAFGRPTATWVHADPAYPARPSLCRHTSASPAPAPPPMLVDPDILG